MPPAKGGTANEYTSSGGGSAGPTSGTLASALTFSEQPCVPSSGSRDIGSGCPAQLGASRPNTTQPMVATAWLRDTVVQTVFGKPLPRSSSTAGPSASWHG